MVKLITSGDEMTLKENEEFKVLPGETLLAKTEEILQLPDWAFALGSPKMSLLASGLWTHGGKTDPGYNHPLTLGFMNVGSTPVPLKRGQKIFHLTFYKIVGETTKTYAGKGIDPPSVKKSPLDQCSMLDKATVESIKQSDGIKSFRICNYLFNAQNAAARKNKIMLGSFSAGTIITLIVASLWVTGNIPTITGFIGILITQAVTNAVLALFDRFPNWFKKKD